VRKHFNRFDITDIKLVMKNGVFRRFCYIGFKTDAEGLKCVDYFNNSFMDTCKLEVLVAKTVQDDTKDRPWSKYSQGSSQHTAYNPTPIEEEDAQLNQKQKDFLGFMEEEDELKEFLKVYKKGKTWENDDSALKAKENEHEETKKESEIVDVEKINVQETVTENEEIDESKQITLDSTVSDLDYLKLMKQKQQETTETVKINPGRLAILQQQGELLGVHAEEPKQSTLGENKDDKGAVKVVEPVQSSHWVDTPSPDLIADTGRIMVRNLAYSCTYEDLQAKFEKYGLIAEIHLPIDKTTKQSKGYAFVLFVVPTDAVKAFLENDKEIFQGRIIEIVAAIDKPKTHDEENEGTTFKEKRDILKRKNAGNNINWNALFMNSDAVAESMARKLGVKKIDILDKSSDDMAVRYYILI
jgi:multiple RNA-binding domain-containing protein 1